LFVATLLTVSKPYRSNIDNRFYTPAVQTFYEADGKMLPTPQKVFIDGKSAAYLNQARPLHFALFLILLELIVGMLRGFTRPFTDKKSEQAVAPNRSLPPSLKSTSSVRGSEDS
jgi:hypothetical protein